MKHFIYTLQHLFVSSLERKNVIAMELMLKKLLALLQNLKLTGSTEILQQIEQVL